MTSTSAEEFNFVAHKVVSMAEFSQKTAVIKAQLESANKGLLSKLFQPLTKAVLNTKAATFMVQNHHLGVYRHSQTSETYVSGAFLKPFVRATFGESLDEKHLLAAQQVFDECKDYRALLMINMLKPIL